MVAQKVDMVSLINSVGWFTKEVLQIERLVQVRALFCFTSVFLYNHLMVDAYKIYVCLSFLPFFWQSYALPCWLVMIFSSINLPIIFYRIHNIKTGSSQFVVVPLDRTFQICIIFGCNYKMVHFFVSFVSSVFFVHYIVNRANTTALFHIYYN